MSQPLKHCAGCNDQWTPEGDVEIKYAKWLSRSITVPLRCLTADSWQLSKAATDSIRLMYAPGFPFRNADVYLMDLQPASMEQSELDLEPEDGRDNARLMSAMDKLNVRFGNGTLHIDSTGQGCLTRIWGIRQRRLTPQYTTRWEDMPSARA